MIYFISLHQVDCKRFSDQLVRVFHETEARACKFLWLLTWRTRDEFSDCVSIV